MIAMAVSMRPSLTHAVAVTNCPPKPVTDSMKIAMDRWTKMMIVRRTKCAHAGHVARRAKRTNVRKTKYVKMVSASIHAT